MLTKVITLLKLESITEVVGICDELTYETPFGKFISNPRLYKLSVCEVLLNKIESVAGLPITDSIVPDKPEKFKAIVKSPACIGKKITPKN
ncbi:MAG: hypothetical protein ACRCWG_13940 [Sarcina sp.]